MKKIIAVLLGTLVMGSCFAFSSRAKNITFSNYEWTIPTVKMFDPCEKTFLKYKLKELLNKDLRDKVYVDAYAEFLRSRQ